MNEVTTVQTILPAHPTPRACWMVVDDDEAVLHFLASLLESLGVAEVHRFQNGDEALAAFHRAPERFQFVVTDLEMPGMNGIELCRRLRAVAPELKVVLATGSATVCETGAGRCGFFGLLAKPFPAAALWRMVEAAGVLHRPGSNAHN